MNRLSLLEFDKHGGADLKNYTIAFLCSVLAFSPGCSIYKAANAPAPIPLKEIQAGVDRNRVIALLGMPRSTEVTADHERTDMHEYIDGNPQESKARIILYVAGDLFTLGLAELIFWPLELATLQGAEGRAVISYDRGGIAKNVFLTKMDGSPRSTTQSQQVEKEEAMSAYEYRQSKFAKEEKTP